MMVDRHKRHYLKLGFMALVSIPSAANDKIKSDIVTVTDALGRRVSLTSSPQRIVSIFASNTELLYALGEVERIVGIEDYTHFPPHIRDGRTIIGGRLGFSVEAIARLEPDLIITTPARQAVNILLKPMQRLGVPVIVLLHRTIEEIFHNLLLLGKALGCIDYSIQVVNQLRQRLQTLQSNLPPSPRPRVYFETGQNDRGNFTTVKEGSYTYDAVKKAGAVPVFPELTLIDQVSGEAVIAADPDMIIVARNDGSIENIRSRPGWQDIKAVRQKRIFFVPRELFLIPGPRIVDGVELLYSLIHSSVDTQTLTL